MSKYEVATSGQSVLFRRGIEVATPIHMRSYFKSVAEKVWRDDLSTYAAALAFYMGTALAPLFMLLIASIALLDWDLTGKLLDHISNLIGEDAARVFSSLVASVQSQDQNIRAPTSWIATVAMIVSSSVIFGQLEISVTWIFKDLTPPQPTMNFRETIKNFLWSRLVSMLMMVVFVLFVLLSLASSFVLDFSPGSAAAFKFINRGGDIAVFTLLLAFLFKFLPDIETSWKQSFSGAALSAILFSFGKDLIGLYMRTVATKSVYGAAGLPITLLIWLFYSSFVILLGLEMIATFKAHQQVSRSELRPTEDLV